MKSAIIRFLFLLILSACGHLYFYPMKEEVSNPEKFNWKYEDFYFDVDDKIKLHGWRIYPGPGIKKLGTIVQFHGNAENITTHFVSLGWLSEQGYEVYIFDYRGYGKSPDSPSFANCAEDGKKLLEYVRKKIVKDEKVIVYGQSLGGVILQRALQTSLDHDWIDLIVLDSTFRSYQRIGFDKLSDSWITWLLSPLAFVVVSDASAPLRFHEFVHRPLLVIHSKNDPVIPYKFGKNIFDRYQGKKKMWEFDYPSHVGVFFIDNFSYRKKFVDYLKTI